ncbi:hypothetical protein DFH27DRAFT_648556 [Peziza echinospora]|nr:hypothetical protein DFH27DRAFT_648556 [Peziza echinospora]
MKYLNLLHIAIGLLSLSGSTLVQGKAIPNHPKPADVSPDVYATHDVEAVYNIRNGPSEVHIGSPGQEYPIIQARQAAKTAPAAAKKAPKAAGTKAAAGAGGDACPAPPKPKKGWKKVTKLDTTGFKFTRKVTVAMTKKPTWPKWPVKEADAKAPGAATKKTTTTPTKKTTTTPTKKKATAKRSAGGSKRRNTLAKRSGCFSSYTISWHATANSYPEDETMRKNIEDLVRYYVDNSDYAGYVSYVEIRAGPHLNYGDFRIHITYRIWYISPTDGLQYEITPSFHLACQIDGTNCAESAPPEYREGAVYKK